MPLHDNAAGTAMANQLLDGILGAIRSSGSEDEYQVEGWIDDPRQIGAQEADFTGYTPATLDSDDWDDAEGRAKSPLAVVSLGVASVAGSDAIRYWALRNTTLDLIAYSAPLERPVYASAGAVNINPIIFFA